MYIIGIHAHCTLTVLHGLDCPGGLPIVLECVYYVLSVHDYVAACALELIAGFRCVCRALPKPFTSNVSHSTCILYYSLSCIYRRAFETPRRLVTQRRYKKIVCESPSENAWSTIEILVHYDTSAIKNFLTSVSLQHELKASDVITLVKKTFFARVSYKFFITTCENADFRTQSMRKSEFYTRNDIR